MATATESPAGVTDETSKTAKAAVYKTPGSLQPSSLQPAATTPVISTTSASAPIHIKTGTLVRLVSNVGGVLGFLYGFVTSAATHVQELLGENGEPFLSVFAMTSKDLRTIAADPGKAFTLYTAVPHVSQNVSQDLAAGIYWIDLLPDAGEEVDLPGFDISDVQNTLDKGEIQRKKHDNVGIGPVADPDVAQASGTATSVALGLPPAAVTPVSTEVVIPPSATVANTELHEPSQTEPMGAGTPEAATSTSAPEDTSKTGVYATTTGLEK